PNLPAELLSCFAVDMVTVFLQFGAAPAAVGNDIVGLVPLKYRHIGPGGLLQAGQIPRQHVGRAAADLAPGGYDLVAEAGEQFDGRPAGVGKDQAHDAAEEKTDRAAFDP